LFAISLVTIGMSVYIWKNLSNGNARVLWHSSTAETTQITANIVIIIIIGIIIGATTLDPPSIYPYAVR